jgi:hypothetical protein
MKKTRMASPGFDPNFFVIRNKRSETNGDDEHDGRKTSVSCCFIGKMIKTERMNVSIMLLTLIEMTKTKR